MTPLGVSERRAAVAEITFMDRSSPMIDNVVVVIVKVVVEIANT